MADRVKPPVRFGVILAVLLGLAVVAFAAIKLLGGSSADNGAASTMDAAVAAGSTATGTAPTVVPLDAGALMTGHDAAPVPDPADAAPPASSKKGRDRRRGGKDRRRKETTPAVVDEPAADTPDAQAIQRRFRRARKEYQSFKSRFGPRLEKQWNELAQRATYARSPEQLAELDAKIRAFRGLVRAESDK